MSEEEKINYTDNNSQSSLGNENISEETIQHTTHNTQLNEQNMEVHKHPHHPTHKKKWPEYLLEFFMLFLAVFLGFVAENVREHSVELQRSKVYAANLYEELKKDSTSINRTIDTTSFMADKLDTFCLYSTEKAKLKISNGMLYYYGSYTTLLSFYTSDNTTIEELKSSGNLRIMGNEISEKINVYLKLLSELENEYALTRTEFAKIEELYFKIFDGYTTQLFILGPKPFSRDSIFKLNIPLINDDPKLIKEFTGWQKFEERIYQRQIYTYLLPLKHIANDILTLLKEKYHLK